MTLSDHEIGWTKAFLVKQKVERYQLLLANPRRRKGVLAELAHFSDRFDPRFINAIPSNEQTPDLIAARLRKFGAPEDCYLTCEDESRDGKLLRLSDALRETVGRGIGTVLSCVPGKLGYFEDEDARFILLRP